MFNVRLLKETDYKTLVNWWEHQKFPAPPLEMLPQNGMGGIMVIQEKKDVCAGFIYTTNSKIAWLEFIVANYEYREKDRKDAIQLLIISLCDIAQSLGFKAVFTSVQNQSLVNHLKATGFSADERKSTEMTKLL